MSGYWCCWLQPFLIFKQFVPAVSCQFEIVRHDDRFRRTNLRAQIAQNANFEVDVERIDDTLPFFSGSGFGLPVKRDAFRRTNARALVADDAFVRIKMLNAAKAVRHFQRNSGIAIRYFFLRS